MKEIATARRYAEGTGVRLLVKTTEDLAPTMAALDTALQRVHAAAGWLDGERRSVAAEPDGDETMADEAGGEQA